MSLMGSSCAACTTYITGGKGRREGREEGEGWGRRKRREEETIVLVFLSSVFFSKVSFHFRSLRVCGGMTGDLGEKETERRERTGGTQMTSRIYSQRQSLPHVHPWHRFTPINTALQTDLRANIVFQLIIL